MNEEVDKNQEEYEKNLQQMKDNDKILEVVMNKTFVEFLNEKLIQKENNLKKRLNSTLNKKEIDEINVTLDRIANRKEENNTEINYYKQQINENIYFMSDDELRLLVFSAELQMDKIKNDNKRIMSDRRLSAKTRCDRMVPNGLAMVVLEEFKDKIIRENYEVFADRRKYIYNNNGNENFNEDYVEELDDQDIFLDEEMEY